MPAQSCTPAWGGRSRNGCSCQVLVWSLGERGSVQRPMALTFRRAVTHALHLTGIVSDVNGLQIGVHIERLRAGLAPSVARLTQTAKRHVRFAAVRAAV